MPIHNEDIAEIFDEIADLLEIQDANPFRVRAYRNGARTVRDLGQELTEWVNAGKDLTKLPGIGKELAAKTAEIVQTGSVKALTKLHQEIPASLKELLKIPGLGPKRVRALFKELGIKNTQQLEKAAQAGQVSALPHFGSKTEQHILEILAVHRETKRQFLHSVATQYAEPLVGFLKQIKGVKNVVVAGSYRRGKETVGDLDILVTASSESPVTDRFISYDEVEKIISSGTTRATVVLLCGLQVDLRVVEHKSLGAALHYFTGSKAHNIHIRRLGQQAGLKINEYGVYKGAKRIAGKTEESVFKALGLSYISPELREDRGEVDAARRHSLPKLLELADIQGNLHTHTTATDGRSSLKEMALAAMRRNLDYLAITDHSQRLTMVNGLTPKRLLQQMEEIDRLNAQLKGITLLKGIEVDILEDGNLDLPNTVLQELDLVIGAVHSYFNLSKSKQTARILRAMDNRYFSILAHPSGRLLNERKAYEVDIPRIIEKARERGCFLELNSQPTRLDLTDTYCHMAQNRGVLISVNSDAHSEYDLDNLKLGVVQARRGWLEQNDILNTRPLPELRQLLQHTMG